MSAKISTPIPDGEYDIDVSGLLASDKFEENFAIRYGFVPESIDDELPSTLVRDTTSTSTTEESYILKAESVTSKSAPILFEGTLNKSLPSLTSESAANHDYVLVYDSVGRAFKLQKLSGILRMSKSRNEVSLLKKLDRLSVLNKEKIDEQKATIDTFALKAQESLRPRARVRQNATSESKIIIPQEIPLPKQRNSTKTKTPASAKDFGKGKISASKIRESLKKKNPHPRSSPLIRSMKNTQSNSNSNSDIDDMELDKVIGSQAASESKSRIIQPKPTVASQKTTKIASKRLPSSQAATPVLTQQKGDEQDSDDSDLGSLAFELEEALEGNKEKVSDDPDTKANNDDDDWGEPNMDWDFDDDDFDIDNDDGDSNFNIVIDEPRSSQPESSQRTYIQTPTLNEGRESTPSGPISMKELASLRSGADGGGSSPLIPTPNISTSSTFRTQQVKSGLTVSSAPTPKIADDSFSNAATVKKTVYDDDEDISEEE